MSTILILEDEPFIALDLEETLVESGHQDHVTLSTCKDASAWLDAHTPAAAIIDPRLSDGICTTVVRRLSENRRVLVQWPSESGTGAPRGRCLEDEMLVFVAADYACAPVTAVPRALAGFPMS